jgi:hypothetical protein
LKYLGQVNNLFGVALGCWIQPQCELVCLGNYKHSISNTWQQTLTIHPNNNHGTETQQSTSDFDANGNLLTLNNIGTLIFMMACVKDYAVIQPCKSQV